jgi:hypothetical protein
LIAKVTVQQNKSVMMTPKPSAALLMPHLVVLPPVQLLVLLLPVPSPSPVLRPFQTPTATDAANQRIKRVLSIAA